MTLLANVLQGDRTDPELIQIALEALANVMTFEAENQEGKTFALLFPSLNYSTRTTQSPS